jgi:ArsR family transcriptional regulator, arsenate/arsenite/antimonite-responsive transcriptional repressor
MTHTEATSALSALGDELRLTLFRLLVKRGPEGYAAGELGERLGLAPPNLSFHLKVLAGTGLVSSRREGRFHIYSASFPRMDALLAYLTENCCSLASAVRPGCEPGCAPAKPAQRRRTR